MGAEQCASIHYHSVESMQIEVFEDQNTLMDQSTSFNYFNSTIIASLAIGNSIQKSPEFKGLLSITAISWSILQLKFSCIVQRLAQHSMRSTYICDQ